MELEIGVVGGEEDGVSHEINDKLYTTSADALRTAELLGLGENGRYLLAATFGNVHGVYKPGNVKLRPGGAQGAAGRPSPPSTAKATSRSTWSSTAARARCSRRSARPSTTAW